MEESLNIILNANPENEEVILIQLNLLVHLAMGKGV
jgi:hypothetical protein